MRGSIVRTLRSDDIDGVADLTARVFASEAEREGVAQLTRAAHLHCPLMPPELCWVVEAEGRPVAKLQVLDLAMHVAGLQLRVGGIQGLVAEPTENHKGHAAAIGRTALPALLEKGFEMVVGFAQRGAWYSRLGAVPLMAEYDVSLDSRDVPRLGADPFRRWDETRLPELIDDYERAHRTRSGSLVRSLEYWPWMVRKPSEFYICDQGYFGIERKVDHVEIRDIGGQGQAFHDAVLRKLAEIGRELELRWINAQLPPDHPLALAAVPYGARLSSRYSKRSGCMGLCLDPLGLVEKISAALDERLRLSADGDTCVHLSICCPNAERTFSLNREGGTERRVELKAAPGAIAQLVLGYRSVRSVLFDEGRRSARAGGEKRSARDADSAASDEESIRLLETLFPMGHPHMSVSDRY